MNERALLERLRDRDERAFRELMEAYQDRVFNLVLRMLGRRDEAEDVAQEVFVTVFKAIDQFRGDSKLSTWLYRVAVNHCKNRLKYLARRAAGSTDELDEAAERSASRTGQEAIAGGSVPRPDRALESRQTANLVQAAIAELDEDFRLVVVLRDVEELAYDEICAITGLPEGTVKSRLHRARLALKEKLAKHHR